MKIGNLEVTLKAGTKDIVITSATNGTVLITPSSPTYPFLISAYLKARGLVPSARTSCEEEILKVVSPAQPAEKAAPVCAPTEKDLQIELGKLLQFFKEFEFAPSFRFVNTLARAVQVSNKQAVNYIQHYFALIDSPYAASIAKKCECEEFKQILATIAYFTPKQAVNNRLAVYYGAQGTGKTTIAQQQCEGRCIICNNSMVPADLMEDFIFVDGKPSFKPSALWECIVQGKPIVLDEMNLLPFESLRFLQGLLDGKETFLYKGNTIKVADGFKIIGTMNLVVDGAVFSLPTPLVDRCDDIEEFELSAKQLLSAIL